jgi:hypothetical protein
VHPAAIDDMIADGTQTVTVTASAAGFTSGSDVVNVMDNETPTLTVDVAAASVAETAGATATTVTITAGLAGFGGGETLDVTDREELTLWIEDGEISEKGGVRGAAVTRTDSSGNLVVALSASDDMEAEVPPTVVFRMAS